MRKGISYGTPLEHFEQKSSLPSVGGELFDHSSTKDGRGNNGGCTSRKCWKPFASEQKPLKTSGNCYKKHQKSLGEDEAGGSNLPNNSKSTCFLRKTGVFHNFLSILESGLFARPTHRPQRRKHEKVPGSTI